MAGRRSSVAALLMHAKPLLKFGDEKATLEREGLDVLSRLPAPLYVVILMGDGRAGKSYLASRVLGLEAAFESSDSCEPVTEGIDIIAWPMAKLLESMGIEVSEEEAGMHMLMLDCEGGNNAMAAIRTLVNVFGVAISTEVLFVAGGMLSEAALQCLGGTVAARSLIRLGDSGESLKQNLMFVVNKNTLNYDSGALEKTLTTPQKDKGRKENRDLIAASFPTRTFLGVPLMGQPGFEEAVTSLRTQVMNDRRPLAMGGVDIGGKQLCELLTLIVDQMQSMNEVSFPSMNRCVVLEGFLIPLADGLFDEAESEIPELTDYDADFLKKDPREKTMSCFDKQAERCKVGSPELVEEARKALEEKLNTTWDTQAKLNEVYGAQTKEIKTETREIKSKTTRAKMGGNGLMQNVVVTINEIRLETRCMNIKKRGDIEEGEWTSNGDRNFTRLGEPVFQDLAKLPRVEGFLNKKSPNLVSSILTLGKGKYQTRMCVVKEGHFIWWDKDKAQTTGASGGAISFLLNKAKVTADQSSEYLFDVGPAGDYWEDTTSFTTGGSKDGHSSRVFTFSAEGFSNSRDKWVQAIRANIEFGNKVGDEIGKKRVIEEIGSGVPALAAATARTE